MPSTTCPRPDAMLVERTVQGRGRIVEDRERATLRSCGCLWPQDMRAREMG